MQITPRSTRNDLRDALWVSLASITQDTPTLCQCLETSDPSGLYITRDGIITHNSSPSLRESAPLSTDAAQQSAITDQLLPDEDSDYILASQGERPSNPFTAAAMRSLDQFEAQARAETDGSRTIGDPRLAHSMDNEFWMAADELRKIEFERERAKDWQAVAERMVNNDYEGVKNALLEAAAAGVPMTPPQTLAAKIVIARETMKPETEERRIAIYQLITAYRETGAAAGRSLAARRDPLRTPQERWAAFFADALYMVPPEVQKKMDVSLWLKQKDARIRHLENELRLKKQGSAKLQKELDTLRLALTKEQILRQDHQTRIKDVEAELAKLGLTIEDLKMGGYKLTLVGHKVSKNVKARLDKNDARIADYIQHHLNATPRQIAQATGASIKEINQALANARKELRAQIFNKIKNGGMTDSDMEMEFNLASQPNKNPAELTDEEAERIFERIALKMGLPKPEQLGRLKVKKGRSRQAAPSTQTPTGKGKEFQKPADWEYMPPGRKELWASDPFQHTPGEGRTTPSGQLDLEDNSPWTGDTVYRLDPNDIKDMLHAKRALQLANPKSWVDYVTEIGIANLLSAPITAITNYTGFLYAAYEMTLKKLVRASLNAAFFKSADAEQFGEFKIMAQAMIPSIANAWINAKMAWDTESSIFDKQVLNSEGEFDFFDSGLQAVVGENILSDFAKKTPGLRALAPALLKIEKTAGWLNPIRGRVIRIPFRQLLAADEFFKTIIGTSHAASLAYRSGKKLGLDGQKLQNFIQKELSERGSRSWELAFQESLRLSFQERLRGGNAWKRITQTGDESFPLMLESALHFISDWKNKPTVGAGLHMQIPILLVRAFFPFLRTPYRLIEAGINETPAGAIHSLFIATRGVKVKDMNGKTVLHRFKGDDARVAASATILTSSMLMLALLRFGEGDDDDDEKFILISGNKERQTPGMRSLAYRTMPPYTIRIGGPGGYVISYQRMDPFATTFTAMVNFLREAKNTAQGRRALGDMGSNVMAGLFNQILDKANLTGFDEISQLASGRLSPLQYLANKPVSLAVPNAIRNPARNLDPYIRDTKSLNPLERAIYNALPLPGLAPPPRRDTFGRPVEKLGNAFTRTFVAGNPSSIGIPDAFDANLQRFNQRNPGMAYAPTVPANRRDRDSGRISRTPEQYSRYLKLRGSIFRDLLEEEGFLQPGLRFTEDDIQKIKSLGAKATREANAIFY